MDFSSNEITHFVLPLPAFTSDGAISGGPPFAALEARLHPGITVLGGKLESRQNLLEHTGATVLDYFHDEFLTAANAAITAEGALLLAMEQLPVTLADTPVLVIGWGRIGQLLSRKLQALGAHVTASARRSRDLGMIQALGLQTATTANGKTCLHTASSSTPSRRRF